MEYHTVEKVWKVGADHTCRLPHCRRLLHTSQPAVNQGDMEGRRHVNTRAWSIVDRFAMVWSICLHQQAIPRDLDEHWLHCWPQQCQRTYPKHNVGKCPQPFLRLLVIAQETVAINLMILRDPGILQNRETRATGPPSVSPSQTCRTSGKCFKSEDPFKALTSSVRKATWRSSWAVDLTTSVHANLPYSYHTCCLSAESGAQLRDALQAGILIPVHHNAGMRAKCLKDGTFLRPRTR